MNRARHIGIVAVSAEGAALCYRTICSEGAAVLGPHDHPQVTLHTYPLAEYMPVGGTKPAGSYYRARTYWSAQVPIF
jgi:hypothetical protein